DLAMKVHVEAKPLHEPIAGGTPGATVTVEPLLAGQVEWPMTMMESPGGALLTPRLLRDLLTGRTAVTVPCPVFLIRHPSIGAVIVDTGLHPSIATDPAENFGSLRARFAKPSLQPGEEVAAPRRERGLDAGEAPIAVMTHRHMDHSSAISESPSSTIVISEAEWRSATEDPRPAMSGYRHAHYDLAFEYRTVD